jgi:hypothetical protein
LAVFGEEDIAGRGRLFGERGYGLWDWFVLALYVISFTAMGNDQ